MPTRHLGRPIAVGRTAEIYAWEPGWVLKLFLDPGSRDRVEYEQRIANAICGTALPVPAVGPIVTVAGRVGLLYQHCEGESMVADLANHTLHLFRHARRLAALHAAMHERAMRADIPSLRSRLEDRLRRAGPLPEPLRAAALAALAAMPEGDRLCHGDFHPGNVLLSRPDPVIIDWSDAAIGNSLADVARTSILLLGAAAIQPTRGAHWGIRIMHALYLRHYFKMRPGDMREYRRWLPIVAGARLSEGITEAEPWLLSQAGKLL